MNATAAASLRIGPLGARFEGPLLGVGQHASGVACVIEALEGTVRVLHGGKRVQGPRVGVPAGVVHEVRAAPGARLVFWYLEAVTLEKVQPLGRRALRQAEVSLPAVRDWRVRRCLAALEGGKAQERLELAAAVGLSSSRLRHLVRAELGVPLARLRWWFQMRRAAHSLHAGADLTRAAHAAGFSDLPHFTRTFRRMFGFAPSLLLQAGVRLELT